MISFNDEKLINFEDAQESMKIRRKLCSSAPSAEESECISKGCIFKDKCYEKTSGKHLAVLIGTECIYVILQN